MMKKVQKVLISALCLTLGASVMAACGDNDGGDKDAGNKVTVTFYDATGTNTPSQMTAIRTEKVEKGSTLESFASYVPTKSGGYEFVNWFATPSKNHRFDFSEEITEDTAVYGGFSLYVEDTRDFYIIGAGTSNVLIDGWGVINDKHKFTKAEGKNEYSLKLDLMEGDQFTINADEEYRNKHGAGYLTSTKLADGTDVFEGLGSVFDDSAKGKNIVVKYSGNYTLTLKTYPNEDYYDTEREGYTEERKDIYANNPYDTISWVRNGNMEEELQVVTDYYIKGSGITGWQDMYNAATKLVEKDGVYTLSVYLKKGDEFLFSSTNTVGANVSVGAEYLRGNALDDASKAYLDVNAENYNMQAKESGTYTFSYNKETKVMSVTFDAEKTPVATDYYIDGTFAEGVADWSGYCFNDDYKLTETVAGSGVYKISNVAMKAGSQFIIQAFKAGSTERGEWGTDGYNGLGSYNYTYVNGGTGFSAVGGGNNNIKVLNAGTYDISFDSYTKIITITEYSNSADIYDIYIKGENINGWSHGFTADWLFKLSDDETKYEFTLTVEAGKAVKFGLEKHPKGEKTGYGSYLGASSIGTSGDANALFTPASGTDLTCSTAGTYKIVYDIATEKVDFYTVTAE